MNRMFLRIMAVVMAAILLLTLSLSLICYFTVRSQRINARLEYLSSEAEDIAYLAGGEASGFSELFYMQDTRSQFLNWKAKKVNDEFGAYIAVVDRWGNMMDNIRTAYSEEPDFVDSLSGAEIRQALEQVLAGETIRVQSLVGGAPTFTVGVPFLRYGTVTGAVLIQTKAQRIQSGMEDLIWMIGAAAIAVLVLCAVAVSLFVRSIMRPLGELTQAAAAMAEGDFSIRVDETRGDPELRRLSGTFNTMAGKLKDLEESRREFVANVSHELRSPITSIRGFAEGMADGVIPAEEHPKYLRLVADESRRLSGLVGELLELSRLEREDATLERTDFDLNEMLRRAVIRRMNELDEKQLDVECRFAEDPCVVRADSGRIEEVVINLLDNAIKFSEEKGKIILETQREGKNVRTTVWDSGISVPEEDREKIFERFFTADRAHTAGKGTGLGLSICQRIMEMHGESLVLLSEEETRAYGKAEGGGAAFRFVLPAGGENGAGES